jgi:phosphotransferase system  glucose/maltose/N-acetylglucosamine-specific IIC component
MSRVYFLIVTAVAEVGLGLALLVLPAGPLALLLGISTPAEDSLFIARIAGAALLAIGVMSSLARRDPGSPALRGVLSGILVYDALAALLLNYAGVVLQMDGPALWPAMVLHTVLAIWCVVCLQSGMRGDSSDSRVG